MSETATVQVLQPILNDVDPPSFDRYSHDKPPYAANKQTCIAWSDKERMHIESYKPGRHRRWIPTFAANDEKLRKVIAFSAWCYAANNKGAVGGTTMVRRAGIFDATAQQDIAELEAMAGKQLDAM